MRSFSKFRIFFAGIGGAAGIYGNFFDCSVPIFFLDKF